MDKETWAQVHRFAWMLLGGGLVLIAEHVIETGFTEWELLGHETYGVVAVIVAWALLLRKRE